MTVVMNNILSYIQSARDSNTVIEIINTVENFYKSKEIQKSKTVIYETIGEAPKGRRDTRNDIQDILNAFDSANEKQIPLPTYAAVGKDALPPANGYEFLKDVLDNVSLEITSLKTEITKLKSQKKEEFRDEVMSSISDLIQQMKQEFINEIVNLRSEFSVMNNDKQIASTVRPINTSGPNSCSREENVNTETGEGNKQPFSNSQKPDYRLQYHSTLPQGVKAPNFAEAAKRQRHPEARSEIPKKLPQTPAPPKSIAGSRNDFKPRTKKPIIRGTKQIAGKPLGAVRYADLYVGGCYKNVTPDDITTYCTNSLNIVPNECVALVTKSKRFNSFKITFDYENREKLLDGALWPVNIVVRKFTQPRVAPLNNFSSKNNDVGSISHKTNNTG